MTKTCIFSSPDDYQALAGKHVLITGGTGSLGQELVRELLSKTEAARVIVLSRDELKQSEMMAHWANHPKFKTLRFFIGDVRDHQRLEMAFRNVDVIIHAAALKHVPIAEYNPFECIHTNVLGAENVVRAALQCGVERVVALSTDKAAGPVNLYGASKLASDKIFVAANNLSGQTATRFCVVRYGNVVRSRGSVIPLFSRLIGDGATSLPITDPRMTRFSITLNQGAGFVISCLSTMRGGEIFVPKIPSLKITDIAKAMAPHLSQQIVGIRPGEKLHEVMITEDDARNTLELADRYIIRPVFSPWADKYSSQHLRGEPVAEGFRYASDTNSDWLDVDQLRTLISETDERRRPD